MTKNILLAATAASVMAFAGAASAHTLTFRTTGAGGSIDATETGGAALPYKLAAEAKTVSPAFKQFDLVDTLSVGSSLPSGNVVLTLTLTNGTWGAPLTAGNVQVSSPAIAACTTFTAVPSSGGASGGTTATFLISNSSAGCGSFNLDLPIAPGATGTVRVSATLATEAGTPIDPPNPAGLDVVTRPSGFDGVLNGNIGAGALTDTYATLLITPVYTTFAVGGSGHAAPETATLGQLGTAAITVGAGIYKDLNATPIAAADVTSANLTVAGSYTAFDGAGGAVTLGGTPATTLTTSSAAFSGAGFATAMTGGAQAFRVQRETAAVPIPSSTYAATLSYTLDPAFYNQDAAITGPFETIGRDGTNVVFPWMNSTSIQTATGSTNLVRLGNISSAASGAVYAQVLNTFNSASGYTPANGGAPVQVAASIPANGELVITTATLTTLLGNWGRGDVQISVEAASNTITARRYATLANGSITEFQSGTVAADQNNVNVP